jgi:DNA-binding transcriptional LysR family regulator
MARQPRYLDLSADLDSRKLRYFLAVAHHLNFGRAAEELLLAQPALSRAIRALETDLGVTLFERDHHKVTLTPAGTVLVREAETLLARAAAARRHVQAADRSASTLTIGFRPGIIITEVVQQFTGKYPEAAVPAELPSLAQKRVQTELPSGLPASSADHSRHCHPEYFAAVPRIPGRQPAGLGVSTSGVSMRVPVTSRFH